MHLNQEQIDSYKAIASTEDVFVAGRVIRKYLNRGGEVVMQRDITGQVTTSDSIPAPTGSEFSKIMLAISRKQPMGEALANHPDSPTPVDIISGMFEGSSIVVSKAQKRSIARKAGLKQLNAAARVLVASIVYLAKTVVKSIRVLLTGKL